MTISKGPRKGTRKSLQKSERGKTRPNEYLKEFSTGSKVRIDIESGSHRAMPHPKFNKRSGVISEKRGKAYVVKIKDGNKTKKLTVAPEHLNELE
ncbi:MAG: 50S ribosomal protein L21e [Candidatus Aenigmatarchaeota archaeon]